MALGSVGFDRFDPEISDLGLSFVLSQRPSHGEGLSSADAMQLDLMRTYNASPRDLTKLRWPAALPFLFASLKVSISISLVWAIVGELPTGRRRARRAPSFGQLLWADGRSGQRSSWRPFSRPCCWRW